MHLPRPRSVLAPVLALSLLAAAGCTPDRPALQFSPTSLPDASVGAPYTVTITVSRAATPVGGASVQDGALPPGVELSLAQDSADTIRIAGIPTTTGTYTFRVYVWCYGTNVNGQTATQAYTLVVK
jgi:hypothetical protein